MYWFGKIKFKSNLMHFVQITMKGKATTINDTDISKSANRIQAYVLLHEYSQGHMITNVIQKFIQFNMLD